MAETCKLCNAERGPLHAHPDATVLARKLIEAVEAERLPNEEGLDDEHRLDEDVAYDNAINDALTAIRDTCKKLGVNVDG